MVMPSGMLPLVAHILTIEAFALGFVAIARRIKAASVVLLLQLGGMRLAACRS
jgi:hypothetical protein